MMLTELGSGQGMALLLLVVGLTSCFLGYRLFKFLIGVFGFLAGSILAGFVYSVAVADPGAGIWIAALVGGVIGSAVFYIVYPVAVFGVGAGFGALAAGFFVPGLAVDPRWFVVGTAVVAGILALLVQRFVITVATAFLGAWFALQSGLFLMGLPSVLLPRSTSLFPVPSGLDARQFWGWIFLAAVGLAVQLHRGPAKREPAESRRPESR